MRIETVQNPGLCSTISPERPPPVTPSSGFLNLVSLVRFQPGAPLSACIWALSHFGDVAISCRIGRIADILPTSTRCNCNTERLGGWAEGVTTAHESRDYVSLCELVSVRILATNMPLCRHFLGICGPHTRISAHIQIW